MLRELHISNLAVISDARIELAPGLNCFTGATGAGKSLVIGAIELLLGLRGPSEMLRPGHEEGRVTGLFDIGNKQTLRLIEQLTDVQVTADGGEVLLTRRLYRSGRSSVTLNGNPITLAMLKQVAESLVDVHGQHDHQYLLRPSNQLDVLDAFGGLLPLRSEYHQIYEQVVNGRRRLHALTEHRSLREQQLDLFRFQADEIDAAALDAAEHRELLSRVGILQNLERLRRDVGATQAALYEADGAVLERLRGMSAVLAELAGVDANLQPAAQNLRDATIQLEDVAFDLSRYLDKLDLDPGELAEVNDRLNTVNRVLSKYGDTVDNALAYRAEIGAKIEELSRENEDLAALNAQLKPMTAQLEKVGGQLSAGRAVWAAKLAPLVEKQLGELGMQHAKFQVVLTPAVGVIDNVNVSATPAGLDQVEWVAQTNPGQSPLPLRKIASGGELSRVMLALKSILADNERISVLVFDEIDANVGGRLGSVIGNKLRRLASHHQVLCITHLPQIASYADRHLTVRKTVEGTETRTSVRVMEGEERVAELAEMIGGAKITETTRAQVRELLASARSERWDEATPNTLPEKTTGTSPEARPNTPRERSKNIPRGARRPKEDKLPQSRSA